MNNYKIRVNNEAESREAQELFFELGYGWTNEFEKKVTTSQDAIDDGYSSNYQISFIYAEKDGRLLHDTNDQDAYKSFVESTAKELTLPQLRDLVAQSKSNEQGLISGADALRALADGEEVEYLYGKNNWLSVIEMQVMITAFTGSKFKFRLKPRTVKLEIEVPAPFEPKYGDYVFTIDSNATDGWTKFLYQASMERKIIYGAWRTEAEIKIVVEQLHKLKGHSK